MSDLTKNTKILLEKIKELSEEQGYTLKTNKFFANELNVSERTISRVVKKLIDGRHITVKQVYNRNRRRNYKIFVKSTTSLLIIQNFSV